MRLDFCSISLFRVSGKIYLDMGVEDSAEFRCALWPR